MFGDDNRSVAAYLMQAERYAIDKCRFDQNAALDELVRIIDRDRRFDHLDSQRLAEQVVRCRHNGAVLDLDAPELRVGGAAYSPLRRI